MTVLSDLQRVYNYELGIELLFCETCNGIVFTSGVCTKCRRKYEIECIKDRNDEKN